MTESKEGGVRITPPPDLATQEVADRLLDSPTDGKQHAVSFSGSLDSEDSEDSEAADRLDKFLSARPRTQPETKKLWVESLGTTIVVRELSQREADDVFEMFEGRLNRRGTRRRGPGEKSLSEIQAHLVAKALVEPNLNDPNVLARFQEKYEGMGLPDILLHLIKPLEITAIFDKIMEISGGNEDAVVEAKN